MVRPPAVSPSPCTQIVSKKRFLQINQEPEVDCAQAFSAVGNCEKLALAFLLLFLRCLVYVYAKKLNSLLCPINSNITISEKKIYVGLKQTVLYSYTKYFLQYCTAIQSTSYSTVYGTVYFNNKNGREDPPLKTARL